MKGEKGVGELLISWFGSDEGLVGGLLLMFVGLCVMLVWRKRG